MLTRKSVKSYYELTSEEIQNYKVEFLKLEYSKKFAKNMIDLAIIVAIVFSALAIFEIVLASDEFAILIDIIVIPFALALCLIICYYNFVSFRKWLKTKYNIE